VGRASNGHRRYGAEDLAWIEFLTRLRATGMPIRSMRRYADLRRAGPATVSERREMLEAHGRAIRKRLDDLGRNLAVIETKVATYKEMEARDGEARATDALRARRGQAGRG
jgi:DNA-binding transcriptional MerR regulator